MFLQIPQLFRITEIKKFQHWFALIKKLFTTGDTHSNVSILLQRLHQILKNMLDYSKILGLLRLRWKCKILRKITEITQRLLKNTWNYVGLPRLLLRWILFKILEKECVRLPQFRKFTRKTQDYSSSLMEYTLYYRSAEALVKKTFIFSKMSVYKSPNEKNTRRCNPSNQFRKIIKLKKLHNK